MTNISELKFDDKNFNKHTQKGMGLLEKSLQQFGAGRSILIDKDNNIIAGNGIVEAAGQVGLDKVKIIETDGTEIVAVKRTDVSLNSAQGREMALADNATGAADLEWDEPAIEETAEQWGFNIEKWGLNFSTEPHDYFGDERERTYKSTNLDRYDAKRADNKYGFPILHGYKGSIPDEIIGFNEAKTAMNKSVGVHFFIDDYQFERVWNDPDKYEELLGDFDCIFTPDFSLYTDMPLAMKIWNVYRSRMIGQIYEDLGLSVVPTLSWAGEDTFDFVFDGLPKESMYAVSTVGVMRNEETKALWVAGMNRAIEELNPRVVLLYGPDIEFDWGEIKVKKYNTRPFSNKKSDIIKGNGGALEKNQL